jgi:hypothetical protein
MEKTNKLWFQLHKEIRNILSYGLIFYLFIVIISGFQIIPIINFILNGGVVVYLDFIKY